MRIPSVQRRCEQGNIIYVSLIMAGIAGYLLASYLTLVQSQNISTARSQSWNVCIPVLEAGIEEALTHLQYTTVLTNAGVASTNLASDGWALDPTATNYYKHRDLGNGYSFVSRISITIPPVITSTGTAPIPLSGTNLSRTVQCMTRRNALFAKGMVAKGQINMNGNNIRTDSFDSADPNYSTNGAYDPTKTKDNGDVATDSGLINSLNVGNANIFGHASTGPGGSIQIGSNGAVGSKTWQQAGNTGIQPGWSSDDMNVAFPDVQVPFSGGYSTPASGTLGGTNYKYILISGNYELSSLDMSSKDQLLVTGNAILYVTGEITLQGQAQILLATNASLMLYAGTANTNSPVSVSLGGNGVANNGGNATNFYFYGLPSVTSLSLSGNAAFVGAIYAPEAAFTLGGGGNNTYDFVGGSVSSTVTLNGHYNFHYDEALGRNGPSRGYIITSWNEYMMYNEI